MPIYGRWKAATIANGATSSAEVDLGRDYDQIEIIIPTMTSCYLYLTASELTGGTFYTLGDNITTTTGTFNRADVLTVGGFRFIKVVASVAQGAERLIRVRGRAD